MDNTVGFSLAPLQKRLWQKYTDYGESHVQQIEVKILDLVHRESLEQAIENVVSDHEMLRTSFHDRATQEDPLQVINEASRTSSVFWHDVSESCPDRETRITELSCLAVTKTADCNQKDLFRADLVVISPNEILMILTTSALCADQSSLPLIVGHISRAYEALVERPKEPLEILQFADIAAWQCELVQDSGHEETSFWNHHASGLCDSLELPCENTIPQESSSNSAGTVRAESKDAWAAITANARDFGVSEEAWILAGWYALLARLANVGQVGCGVYFDGRFLSELKGVIGPLGRFLPLVGKIDFEQTFEAFVGQVEHALVNAQQRQLAFEAITRPLGDNRDNDFLSQPLGFSFQHAQKAFRSAEATFSLKTFSCHPAPTQLWLDCQVSGDNLITILHYDGQRFRESGCKRLLAQFSSLLRSAAERPSRRVGDLNVLSEYEWQTLITQFNDTATDSPAESCIHRIFERQVEQFSEAIALRFEDSQITYGELNLRANRLAHYLKTKGVGPNVLVGICLERSVDMVVSIFAVLKAGGAYVPMDPSYPQERLEFMLADTETPVVITRESLAKLIPEHESEVVCLDRDSSAIDEQPTENLKRYADAKNLAYVIYTSGSTGKPKGVKITHEGLVISNSARIAFFKRPVKKFLLLSSFSFDSSVVGIFWSLTTGGCLLLVDEHIQHDLKELNQVIATEQVSHLLTLPSYYSLILEHSNAGQLDKLETSIVAGEPCPKGMVDLHKRLLPNVELFSEYGATETTVFNSVYDCREQTLDTAPIGRPIDNSEIYVLDSRMQPVPVGVMGEAFFGGPALSPGYLNRPELNAEKFVKSPFSDDPHAYLYRSGDLLRHLPNGDVQFVGRADNQVKIRGFRIELEEIESVLLQHDSVQEAAVLAIESEKWCGSVDDSSDRRISVGKRLAAYVLTKEPTDALTSELRDLLTTQLPDYMMPSTFIVLQSFPKHPNGKIDRGALPSPSTGHSKIRHDVVNARSVEEEQFVAIWKEVLGIEQIGIHDNFFELGGDSILSIQIVARANQHGIPITPMQLFQHQTIAELVGNVNNARMIHADQDEVVGSVTLTPIHHWFRDRQSPDPSHWNMPLLLELQSEVAIDDLQAAASAILRHHDILRLRWKPTKDSWSQEIVPFQVTPLIAVVDLSAATEDELTELIQKKCNEFQRGLSLDSGPLMQLNVLELGPARKNLLFWNLHHLAGDIVSWQILLEDLQLALDQIGRGASIELPRKSTSFHYWANQLRQYAQAAQVLKEADFWLTEERSAIDGLPLDHENGRETNTEESVRIHNVCLTTDETDQLLRVVPKFYNTQINEVLLTSLHLALQKWSGSSSSLIDVELHGREENCFDDVDLSRTVGWFTSYYPLLLTSQIDISPLMLLRSVKQQMRDIPNRGFHFGLLRYLQDDPEISDQFAKLPAAEVNFNYLGQFGQVVQGTTLYKLANHETTCGFDHSPKGSRSHLIDVVSWVIDDRLQIDFTFSANAHTEKTVTGLAADFLETLRTLIAGSSDHVVSDDDRLNSEMNSTEIDGEPASDFGWDNADLEAIRKAIGKSAGNH
ncbi:MAG: amino acid adenylation domain-containing protein [Rubripirellula sp.]